MILSPVVVADWDETVWAVVGMSDQDFDCTVVCDRVKDVWVVVDQYRRCFDGHGRHHPIRLTEAKYEYDHYTGCRCGVHDFGRRAVTDMVTCFGCVHVWL